MPIKAVIPVLLTTVLLAACSGGGSGNSDTPPPASIAANDTLSVNEDASGTTDVTRNDSNVNAASITIIRGPDNGSAEVRDGGQIAYTPAPDFNGTDTLTYRVDSNNNSGTRSATLTITVNGVNDPPEARDDVALTIVSTPVTVRLLSNDRDIDSELDVTLVDITKAPGNGRIDTDTSNNALIYTPDTEFTGEDLFSYTISDAEGAASNEVSVVLTVLPITQSTLTVTQLDVPTQNYTTAVINESGKTILASEVQTFDVLPNTISFAIYLLGENVFMGTNELFFSELVGPDGINYANPDLFTSVAYCDPGFCSLTVPRRPDITPTPGVWEYRIASATNNTVFDPDDLSLVLARRTGPEVPAALPSTTIEINTVITGSRVDPVEVMQIHERAAEILLREGIAATFHAPTLIATQAFAEVDLDFNDPVTAELVATYNDPTMINLFILDSFTGAGGDGLLGITGGIPATHGYSSRYNGILLNGTATRFESFSYYFRTTAEVLVHELGHYLGLKHTTEADFSDTDLIADTPECLEGTHDLDGDDLAEQAECPDGTNIMFWQNLFLNDKDGFSSDQINVISRSPIARTSGE